MGLKVASNSFCLSLNSSTSAVCFLSNQATASLHLPAIIVLSDSSSLSLMLESSIVDLILKQKDSKPFLASIFSFCFSSSALNFSDSSTIRSISSFDSLPWSFVIVIFSLLPPAFSTAETFKIPFASMSNVTSICGVPRGAGGIPVRLNCPKRWLCWVIGRSPSNTWIVTAGWLSAYVVNVWVCFAGIVVFRLIKVVITPPAVSMPRDKGETSSNSRSLTASLVSPVNIAACTAAPYATASSGLILLFNSLPLKNSVNNFCTFGILVDPPTSTSSSIDDLSSLASLSAFSTGSNVPLKRSAHSSSNLALVMAV